MLVMLGLLRRGWRATGTTGTAKLQQATHSTGTETKLKTLSAAARANVAANIRSLACGTMPDAKASYLDYGEFGFKVSFLPS